MKKAFGALYSMQERMKEHMNHQDDIIQSLTVINEKVESDKCEKTCKQKTTKKTKKE